MKSIISIAIATLFLFAGCEKTMSKKGDSGVDELMLTGNVAPADLTQGNRFLVAIIDRPDKGSDVFRLYSPEEPKLGGVSWDGIPLGEVQKQWAMKGEDRSLWVRMHCKLEQFSAPYPTQPELDPWAVASEASSINFFLSEKVVYPVSEPFPEK